MDPEDNHSANAYVLDFGDDTTTATTSKDVDFTGEYKDAACSLKHTDDADMEWLKSELTCSICAELFVKAVTLNCSHTFCQQCIDKWRKKQKQCPKCRVKIETASPTIAVDSCIGQVLESACNETKRKRKEMIEQRTLELKSKKRKVTVPVHKPTRDELLVDLSNTLFESANWLRESIQNDAQVHNPTPDELLVVLSNGLYESANSFREAIQNDV